MGKDPRITRAELTQYCAERIARTIGRPWTSAMRDEIRVAITAGWPEIGAADREAAGRLLSALTEAAERAEAPDVDAGFRQVIVQDVAPFLSAIGPKLERYAAPPLRRDEIARLIELFDAPAEMGGFLGCGREATARDLAHLKILVIGTTRSGPPEEVVKGELRTMQKTRGRYGLSSLPATPGPTASPGEHFRAFVRRATYSASLYQGAVTRPGGVDTP